MVDEAAVKEQIMMLNNSINEMQVSDLDEAEELVEKAKDLRDLVRELEKG